jgi:hypothetical protein
MGLTFHKLININKFMKYNEVKKYIHTPVFSRQDLLLHGLTVYDYQLTLWVKKGYLLRLKNGLFAFAEYTQKLKGEEVAYLIYQPSYISLESALSYYGLIPEMIYSHISVTAKINRKFNNYFGHFIYRHIKKDLFWGYAVMQTENGFYLLAEPEKALLDYLYLNLSKIESRADLDQIRFNKDQLKQHLDRSKFKEYVSAFNIKKLERWALQCLP